MSTLTPTRPASEVLSHSHFYEPFTTTTHGNFTAHWELGSNGETLGRAHGGQRSSISFANGLGTVTEIAV